MLTKTELLDLVRQQFAGLYFLQKPEAMDPLAAAVAVAFLDQMTVTGFQICTRRQDWKEVRATALAARSADWWYVVANEGILGPRDLPAGWGLFTVRAGVLVRDVMAQKLTILEAVMPRDVAAAIIRHVVQDLPKSPSTKKAYEKGYSEALRDLTASPHWKEMGPDKLSAYFKALSEGMHLRLALELRNVLEEWKGAGERLEGRLKGLEGLQNWQTRDSWSPAAVAYGEKVRAHLQEHNGFKGMSPAEIETLIEHHRSSFESGRPLPAPAEIPAAGAAAGPGKAQP